MMATLAEKLAFLATAKAALPPEVRGEIDAHIAQQKLSLLQQERLVAESFVRTLPKNNREYTAITGPRREALEKLDGVSWDSDAKVHASWFLKGLVVPREERPLDMQEWLKVADLARDGLKVMHQNSADPAHPASEQKGDPAAKRLVERWDADETLDPEHPQRMPLLPLMPDGRLRGSP